MYTIKDQTGAIIKEGANYTEAEKAIASGLCVVQDELIEFNPLEAYLAGMEHDALTNMLNNWN